MQRINLEEVLGLDSSIWIGRDFEGTAMDDSLIGYVFEDVKGIIADAHVYSTQLTFQLMINTEGGVTLDKYRYWAICKDECPAVMKDGWIAFRNGWRIKNDPPLPFETQSTS